MVRLNETGTIQLHYLKILGEFALIQVTLLINRYFCASTGSDEFQRTLSLPDNVDDANAKASFKDGILTVTIPKTEKANAKRLRSSSPTNL